MDFSFQMLSSTSYIDNRDFFGLYIVTVETYRLTDDNTVIAWGRASARRWSDDLDDWDEVVEKTNRALCHEGEDWVYTLHGYEDTACWENGRTTTGTPTARWPTRS